ncbi:hypothetical protein GCM10027028_07940 [Streptomyces sundarbansensis]
MRVGMLMRNGMRVWLRRWSLLWGGWSGASHIPFRGRDARTADSGQRAALMADWGPEMADRGRLTRGVD